MSGHNKFLVATRLVNVENEIVELKRAIKQLQSPVQGPPGRDGICICKQIPGPKGESIVGPAGPVGERGPAGRDGRSIQGQKGDRGEASQVPGPAGPKGDKGDTVVGPKGERGERGDITVYGDAELHEAVLVARKALIEQRAKFLAAIAQAEYDARGDSSVHRIIRGRIEQLKREAGL